MKPITMSYQLIAAILTAGLLLAFNVWAQGPPAPEQEVALRKRVAEFYGYLKVKRAAEAEKYVSSDTLEQYRMMPNGDFVSAEIGSVEWGADKKSATVVINLMVSNAAIPMPFSLPRKTDWRLEPDGWKIVIPSQTRTGSDPGIGFPGNSKPALLPGKPDLTFANPLVDVSPIRQGDKQSAHFSFKNSSDHPVTVETVQFDCKCFKLLSGKKTYKAGEAGEITIEYDSSGHVYKFGESIKVITSPGQQEIMLLLSADVSPAN